MISSWHFFVWNGAFTVLRGDLRAVKAAKRKHNPPLGK
jgi:hypothetical protein